MGNCVKSLLILVFILKASVVLAKDCETKKVFTIIEAQKTNLKSILEGGSKESQSTLVFGEGFLLENTSVLVQKERSRLESKRGILPEHEVLAGCLVQNKDLEGQKQLVAYSTELTNLRIEVLLKNQSLNNAIYEKMRGEKEVPNIKENIEKENLASEKQKKELAFEVLEAEIKVNTINDAKKKEVSSRISEYKKIKIELINKKLEYNKALEEKLAYFEKYSSELSTLAGSLSSLSSTNTIKNFHTVESIWKEISSKNYDLFKTDKAFTLPSIPSSEVKNSGRDDLKKDFEELERVKSELIDLRLSTLKELTLKKNQELKLHNELLLQVNNVRGVLYQRLPADYVLKKVTTVDYYKGIISELTSAPFRVISYFYSKLLYIREQLSKGKPGITILAYDALYLIFLLIVFFILKTLFSNSQDWVDKRVNQLLRSYRNFRLVKIILSLWNKVKDNLEEILWLILSSYLADKEAFSEVRLVILVVQVILISRILKSLVILFFGSVSRIDNKSFSQFKKKAQTSANHISNIYLFYALSLVIADATIGRTYMFSIVKVTVAFYAVYRIIMMSATWEKEFWTYIERHFSGFIITRLEVMFKYVPSKIKATIYFVIIIVFSILNMLIRATENFEISKKISANIFKKQIEKAEVGDGSDREIPEDYRSHFHLQSLEIKEDYVCVSDELELNILTEINEWCDSKSEEHSLVVYGDKGVGKTTLIKHCLSKVEEDRNLELNVIRTKLPSKTYEKSELQKFIKELLLGKEKADIDSNFDLYHIDKLLEKKTIIFLDEAQNIFLSKTGGFGAYDALANMINFSTEKIYWVLSFNKYSWLFIDRAFGRNQFFRNVFELKGWSDTKIKELIMSRHKKTDFRLSFDLLINATRSHDEIDRYASVESKFFKLLWELSRGNPRAALVLWLTALSQKYSKVLNVNIPKEFELVGLEKLPDDLMFVLAHILKHENLTAKEIEGTTDLPSGIVRNSIKVGLEKHFLYRDERGRYMIEIGSQFGLIKFLTLKNFIYGS